MLDMAVGFCAFKEKGKSAHAYSRKIPEFSGQTSLLGNIQWWCVLIEINHCKIMFLRKTDSNVSI